MAAAVAASLSVQAQDQGKGWYLGSGEDLAHSPPAAGASLLKNEECVPLMRRCEDANSAWRLAAGYRFSPYFSAEFQYGDYTERPALDPLGIEPRNGPLVRGLNLSATATWPVLKRLDLFGRVGTRRWETPESGSVDPGPASGEERVTMQLGAGMNYDISDRLGFRAEWERHRGIGGGASDETEEDIFSGYLRFRF